MILILAVSVLLEIIVTPLRPLGIKLNYPIMKLWALVTTRLYSVRITKLGESSPIPSIIVSNHVSYWDILTFAAKFKAYFVAKSSVKTWPLIGQGAMFTRTIFINREKARSSLISLNNQISRRIGENEDVIIFAEGTTSTDPCQTFKVGAFHASKTTGIPVKPVAVYYDHMDRICWVGDKTFISHLWDMTFAPAINCFIYELPLLKPSDFNSSDEMKIHCRKIIQEKIDYIKNDIIQNNNMEKK
ncbi:MAG: 1-acyl-sn-glycerol-3-phosphate acyltransferase [Oligoflexia bacterium]|nr:1-acyl-sn-glycerol-3-phosphate acyltransferase [Oligoflexia bacterium]